LDATTRLPETRFVQIGAPFLAVGFVLQAVAYGHADLVTTARTYTYVLVDEKELDYASLIA
jgi:hypothetical protein